MFKDDVQLLFAAGARVTPVVTKQKRGPAARLSITMPIKTIAVSFLRRRSDSPHQPMLEYQAEGSSL